MTNHGGCTDPPALDVNTDAGQLSRVLTFWPLVFYGLSVIVGAGIYVAIGTVLNRAGDGAPLSFLLAGVTAALTGLCYAELAGRFPEAGGAAAYVRHAFGSDRLAQLLGGALTLTVAVGAASIAKGAAIYLMVLLPLPGWLLSAGIILCFVLIAALGVRESVGLAALTGVMELLALAVVTTAGFWTAPWPWVLEPLPPDLAGWHGILSGAFIGFFAFIGFETLANMGEEVRDPHRTLPRGILGAVAASIIVYVLVALSVVVSGRRGATPLLEILTGWPARIFAVVGFLAVANGVLVHVMMLARLFYGMARMGELPDWLARVHPQLRTPLPATALAGGIVLAAALALPFDELLRLTNSLTLAVFTVVNLALWHIKRGVAPTRGLSVPAWLPPLAIVACLGLLAVDVWPLADPPANQASP